MQPDPSRTRRRFLAGAGAAGAAAWLTAEPRELFAHAAPAAGSSGPLLNARSWLDTPPLRPEDLRGKVVLVNFWTYSCINSLRPLPYVRTWAEKYADRGLVVVGVHTPEFAFEKDPANVRRALGDLGVRYPVVLDSNYAIWRAFANEAWPAFYVLDASGRVRHRRLGEGAYDQSERVLQTLLSDARRAPISDPILPIAGVGPQAAPDWAHLGSSETYVGYGKATSFGSPGGLAPDKARLYRTPERPVLNTWGLDGAWRVGREFAELAAGRGAITYRFHARDLNLILAPPEGARPLRFRVRIDGAEPGADHGFDTDAAGWGRLDAPRMYQLVRQSSRVADRTFEIEFMDPGARAYAFTFG